MHSLLSATCLSPVLRQLYPWFATVSGEEHKVVSSPKNSTNNNMGNSHNDSNSRSHNSRYNRNRSHSPDSPEPNREGLDRSSDRGPGKAVDPTDASLRELNLRLRRLVHQSVSDLIDPSRSVISSVAK